MTPIQRLIDYREELVDAVGKAQIDAAEAQARVEALGDVIDELHDIIEHMREEAS